MTDQTGNQTTPGPWRIRREDNPDGPQHGGVGIGELLYIDGPLTNVAMIGDGGERREANARLIAAAPAMLAALRALMFTVTVTGKCINCGNANAIGHAPDEWCGIALAAITAATGNG